MHGRLKVGRGKDLCKLETAQFLHIHTETLQHVSDNSMTQHSTWIPGCLLGTPLGFSYSTTSDYILLLLMIITTIQVIIKPK